MKKLWIPAVILALLVPAFLFVLGYLQTTCPPLLAADGTPLTCGMKAYYIHYKNQEEPVLVGDNIEHPETLSFEGKENPLSSLVGLSEESLKEAKGYQLLLFTENGEDKPQVCSLSDVTADMWNETLAATLIICWDTPYADIFTTYYFE